MLDQYLLPLHTEDTEGNPRAAGFEFEFGNLPIIETAEAMQTALGGELEQISPFEAVLHESSLGKLKIERDASLLKATLYRDWLEQLGVSFEPGTLAFGLESTLDKASRTLVPCEVVTSPIPFDNLQTLDTLVETLEGIGAEGTQDSLIYAFGLHINPSAADTSATGILRCLQAFLLLCPWFVEAGEIDRTRRYLTHYIDLFPHSYLKLLLDMDYQPDLAQLIDDYLEHNPTRNRALDMLPLFMHLDSERVQEGLPKDERKLVSARPAYHYRLPDCRINDPEWSVKRSWNSWVYVENLAVNSELLEELILTWRDHYSEFSLTRDSAWVQRLTSRLSAHMLAG